MILNLQSSLNKIWCKIKRISQNVPNTTGWTHQKYAINIGGVQIWQFTHDITRNFIQRNRVDNAYTSFEPAFVFVRNVGQVDVVSALETLLKARAFVETEDA